MTELQGSARVPLETVIEALADVLLNYDVPTNKIIAELRGFLAEYMEDV